MFVELSWIHLLPTQKYIFDNTEFKNIKKPCSNRGITYIPEKG